MLAKLGGILTLNSKTYSVKATRKTATLQKKLKWKEQGAAQQ